MLHALCDNPAPDNFQTVPSLRDSQGGAPKTCVDTGWRASLSLGFAQSAHGTRLSRRRHDGPLVVQKPLYPQGDAVCQCVIVHPPAGIAGGDSLALDVEVDAGAHVQLTTPGAAKWYRSSGSDASQAARFRVAAGASLEWMPQGNIVFDGARLRAGTRVDLDRDAAFIGWDVYCLGRTAAHERFRRGTFRQRFEVVRDGALIWSERVVFDAGSAILDSPAGLNSAPVFGTFVAVASRIDDDLLASCREVSVADGECAVTRLPDMLIGRFRGAALEAAHAYCQQLWTLLRPALMGDAAVAPRIWST